MHLTYLDESYDEHTFALSALVIPETEWNASFQAIRAWRRALRQADGIYVYKELHAWKFVSGRGDVSERIVPRGRRAQIFCETLDLVAQLPKLAILNAVFPTNQMEWAYERMVNRLNRTMEARNDNTILFFDEGNESWLTKLIRKMRVFNPIPSDRGTWGSGGRTKNVPTARIIEDPVFKDSAHSYFIQLCDFCSYSLLRRERPTVRARQYGIERAFLRLAPVLFRQANRKDPEGIIRP